MTPRLESDHWKPGDRVSTVFPMPERGTGTISHRSQLTGRWWVKLDRWPSLMLFKPEELLASDEEQQDG